MYIVFQNSFIVFKWLLYVREWQSNFPNLFITESLFLLAFCFAVVTIVCLCKTSPFSCQPLLTFLVKRFLVCTYDYCCTHFEAFSSNFSCSKPRIEHIIDQIILSYILNNYLNMVWFKQLSVDQKIIQKLNIELIAASKQCKSNSSNAV